MRLALIIFFWIMLLVHVIYVYKKGKPSEEDRLKYQNGLKEARKQGLI